MPEREFLILAYDPPSTEGHKGAVNHPLLSKVITAASELAGVAAPAVPAATQVATDIGQTITSQGQTGEKADQPQQNENTPNAPPPPDEDKEPKKEKQPVLQDAWERDLLWDAF